MEHDKKYYTELKLFEITWDSVWDIGQEFETIKEFVYNPCILAKQKIVFTDLTPGHRTVIKVTQAVMDANRDRIPKAKVREIL